MAVALALAGLVATSPGAHAYCRRSNCDGVAGTRCVPARADDCGVPVHWPAAPVPYEITRSDDPHRKAAIAAIDRAFVQWSSADCGDGRRPDLAIAGRIADADPPTGRTPVGLIAFSDDAPERGPGTLAITRLYFRPTSGEILRARTILYTAQLAPHHALHPGEGSFLDAIALHEAGHFLGLAHSADRSAVMSAEVEDGAVMAEDSERGAATPTHLTGDDVAAICAAFPPRDGSSHDWRAVALIAVAAIAAACAAGRWIRRTARRSA